MATDDQQVLVTGTASAPTHFTIPGNGQIQPKAVFAHFDGSGAASSFVPALKVISDGGELVAICPCPTTVAAAGSADVSWFPHVTGCDCPTTTADYGAVVASFGPWAYWKLAEPVNSAQAFDSSGHGRTLDILSGHVNMGQPGLLPTSSQTCAFSIYSGASNIQNFPSANAQTFGASVCTVEHWVNTGGAGGHEQNLTCMGTIGAPTSFLWRCYLTTGAQMGFQFQGTDLASHAVTGAVGVSLNTVHHLVYVMDGTDVSFYIDGVLGDVQPATITMNGPLTSTVFVCQPSGGAGPRDYDGFIGPVVVYDQVLTAADIANLYANGAGVLSGGAVASVTAADTSVVIGGTALDPTIRTNTLDVIAADHPPAASWSNNGKKITSVQDPTAAQDAATKNYVDTRPAGVTSLDSITGAVTLVAGTNVTITDNSPVAGDIKIDVAGGGSISVTDGVTTVSPATSLDFTSGATVTNGGGGVADVAISPAGSAGGDLGGTYPNPTVIALEETGGPTRLAVGVIPDNDFLQRSGTSIIGVSGVLPGTANRSVRLPFDVPDATGNGYASVVAGTNIRTLRATYLNGVDGFWYGILDVPSDYNAGGAFVLWVGANDTTGHVSRWIVGTNPDSTAATFDAAYTAETAQNATMSVTAYQPTALTFTLSTTPVAGNALAFYVERNGANAADTLTVPAVLFKATFTYTV